MENASFGDAIAARAAWNRSGVFERLRTVLDDAGRSGEAGALLLVHVAAVDRIDAAHGFHAGDRMMRAIGDLLRSKALRPRDVLESFSRDEFVCILRPAGSETVAMLGAHRMMSLLAQPMTLFGNGVAPEAAIGVALFPSQASDLDRLLQRAKHALCNAGTLRERVALYAPPAVGGSTIDALECENRLRVAIARNHLALNFQPQLHLPTGRITGAEALLRWDDPILGRIPPDVAVDAAEAAGLIDQLTMWVVTSAVQACRELHRVDPDFTVSINISPSNLREVDFALYVDRALRTWGVKGSGVIIEITESAMLVDRDTADEGLRQLKGLGLRLSVDDFGTGYSSMQYLAQLPLDELKIDLSFVQSMLEQPQNYKIVRALVDLAHSLGLHVVAEGVEDARLLDALEKLGADYVQGYHIGKPMDIDSLVALVKAR